jgi:hypothetical protein
VLALVAVVPDRVTTTRTVVLGMRATDVMGDPSTVDETGSFDEGALDTTGGDEVLMGELVVWSGLLDGLEEGLDVDASLVVDAGGVEEGWVEDGGEDVVDGAEVDVVGELESVVVAAAAAEVSLVDAAPTGRLSSCLSSTNEDAVIARKATRTIEK